MDSEAQTAGDVGDNQSPTLTHYQCRSDKKKRPSSGSRGEPPRGLAVDETVRTLLARAHAEAAAEYVILRRIIATRPATGRWR